MFKVLLVDDEPLITRGLQALIDWEDYGFEVMHVLENGQDALAYMEEHPIDLLVTDIVMPKMTGLELIEQAKKRQPTLKCIILSGYEEFNYIKKGIGLGIENYLIKPVDEVELEQTIEATSEKLMASHKLYSEEEHILKENVLWRLLHGDIGKEEWEQRISFYPIDKQMAFYAVSIIDFADLTNESTYRETKKMIEQNFQANCVVGANKELVMILAGNHLEEMYEKNDQIVSYLQKCCGGQETFYLAMGDVVERIDDISESYFKARENALYQIVLAPNSLISDKTHIDKYSLLKKQQYYKTEIVKQIHESKEATLEGILSFYAYLSNNEQFLVPAVARKYTIDLVTYIHHSIQDVKHYNHTTAIEKLVQSTNNEQIKAILIDYCNELIDAMQEKDKHRSPIVKDVLDYIHASYAEELSLKTLSQRFHVNSIYLGQLFQKEMGIVFSEYINHFRLEKAKELLKTTHLPAGEIGKRVGYADTAYFYKQFKKYVSVTPTEWRKV